MADFGNDDAIIQSDNSFGQNDAISKPAISAPSHLDPIFSKYAEKYNVPKEYGVALAHQESSFNPHAVGKLVKTRLSDGSEIYQKAHGIMQYLDTTARDHGIDPFNAEQSIEQAYKDIRTRLDKGYSDKEAFMAHFAGDDRKGWGKKTRAYGEQLLKKAGLLDDGAPSAIEKKPIDFNEMFPGMVSFKDENKEAYTPKQENNNSHDLNAMFPGMIDSSKPSGSANQAAQQQPKIDVEAFNKANDNYQLTADKEPTMMDKITNPAYWKSIGFDLTNGLTHSATAIGQLASHIPGISNNSANESLNKHMNEQDAESEKRRRNVGRSGVNIPEFIGEAAPLAAAELASGCAATPGVLTLSALARKGAINGLTSAALTPQKNAYNDNAKYWTNEAVKDATGAATGTVASPLLGKISQVFSKTIPKYFHSKSDIANREALASGKQIDHISSQLQNVSKDIGEYRTANEIARLPGLSNVEDDLKNHYKGFKDLSFKNGDIVPNSNAEQYPAFNMEHRVRQAIASDAGVELRAAQSTLDPKAIKAEADLINKNPQLGKILQNQTKEQYGKLIDSLDRFESNDGSVYGAQYTTRRWKNIADQFIHDKHYLDNNIEKLTPSEINGAKSEVLAKLKKISSDKDGSFNAEKYNTALKDMGLNLKADPYADFKGVPGNLNLLFKPEEISRLKNIGSSGRFIREADDAVNHLVTSHSENNKSALVSDALKDIAIGGLYAAHPYLGATGAVIKNGKKLYDAVKSKNEYVSPDLISKAVSQYSDVPVQSKITGSLAGKTGAAIAGNQSQNIDNTSPSKNTKRTVSDMLKSYKK